MKITPKNKFILLLEIYETVNESNRLIRWQKSEQLFFKKYGENAYDDFRIFNARLIRHYTEDVPLIGKVAV